MRLNDDLSIRLSMESGTIRYAMLTARHDDHKSIETQLLFIKLAISYQPLRNNGIRNEKVGFDISLGSHVTV